MITVSNESTFKITRRDEVYIPSPPLVPEDDYYIFFANMMFAPFIG